MKIRISIIFLLLFNTILSQEKKIIQIIEAGSFDRNEKVLPGANILKKDKNTRVHLLHDGMDIWSDYAKREVTVNGVRIVAAGAVGGQTAVPDAFVEKVARMFELFTDPNGAGINEASQRTFIKTLSGDAGTYHAAVGPTLVHRCYELRRVSGPRAI